MLWTASRSANVASAAVYCLLKNLLSADITTREWRAFCNSATLQEAYFCIPQRLHINIEWFGQTFWDSFGFKKRKGCSVVLSRVLQIVLLLHYGQRDDN
jgi:hypothetical protein